MYIVGPAKPEDDLSIVDFQLKMAWETERIKLNEENVLNGVKAVFDRPMRGKYWAVYNHNEIVGCLLTLPEWSDWRNGEVWWIHSVYILPDHRKKGLFRKLYLYLQDIIDKDDKLKGLRLYVEKNNKKAKQVYESMGMSSERYDLYEWMTEH